LFHCGFPPVALDDLLFQCCSVQRHFFKLCADWF
jgi:hypothetical protein